MKRHHVNAQKKRWIQQRDDWNAKHPIGTPVFYSPYKGCPDDQRIATKTRSVAWLLGHGQPVVNLENVGGGCSLDFVEPVDDDPDATAVKKIAGDLVEQLSDDQLAAQLIKELAGTACRCGEIKKPRQTFCRGCYYSLPVPKRRQLYDRIGDGYETAYAEAVEILTQTGRIKTNDQ